MEDSGINESITVTEDIGENNDLDNIEVSKDGPEAAGVDVSVVTDDISTLIAVEDSSHTQVEDVSESLIEVSSQAPTEVIINTESPLADEYSNEQKETGSLTGEELGLEEQAPTTETVAISLEDNPQPAIAKVLSASQIDEMFEINDTPLENPPGDENKIDEENNHNPLVIMEDMTVVLDELKEVDILVCGSCHLVFHFIEEFRTHKPQCTKKSDFHGNIVETKPQVWAFLLWKNAQSKDRKGLSGEESSWKLYQKWCKMSEGIRNAWVAAGETVMNFSTFGQNKPVEPVHKPVYQKRPEPRDENDFEDEHKPVIMKKFVQRDAAGEIREIKSSSSISRRRIMEDAENFQNQLDIGDNSQDKDNNRSVRHVEGLHEEEFVVEKIVSRRFNPRKKQYEYLLKWEGYPSEQNTWEPAENLEACQHLLKAFEENLKKQTLAKLQHTGVKQRPEISNTSSSQPISPNYGGRPIRYSKQKALSQVKQWCGSIKPDDSEIEMLKRKMPLTDSDDDEDPFLKKIKVENKGSDSEDSLSSNKVLYTKTPSKSGIVRRPGRPPLKPKITNGTTESLAAVLGLDTVTGDDGKSSAIEAINRGIVKKSTGMSPHNQQVLVANAKGVVKVDPSQVPNLTSGVYIMSNKSGIIKLDSVSPSKALSLKGIQHVPTTKVIGSGNVTPKPLGPSGSVTATPSASGVILVNRENHQSPKTGLVKRPVGRPPSRGVGRPPLRGNPSYRAAPNPNTRLIHSGTRPNFTVSPGIRPKTPLKTALSEVVKKPLEANERKILGPKPGRGGINRGMMRGGRGGSSGKVLQKGEGEKAPHSSPPHSPKAGSLDHSDSLQISIKKDPDSIATSSFLSRISSSNSKDPLVKKTLKPGSIGSMTVSPKKSFSEEDEMVTISGEDGMVYKVRKSELTNSLLVGEDGQQCVYVTTGEDGDEGTVLTLDPSSYSDSVTQLNQVNILETGTGGEETEGGGGGTTQFFVKGEGEEGELVSLEVEGETTGDDGQSQVVAQLVEASEPEPGGGPRKVVLLLPDGNLMMTEVDEEQYAALELDKYQASSGEMK